jgi:hypothetical protein
VEAPEHGHRPSPRSRDHDQQPAGADGHVASPDAVQLLSDEPHARPRQTSAVARILRARVACAAGQPQIGGDLGVAIGGLARSRGSATERQGAGGVYYQSVEPSGSGRDTPLPPQTVSLAEPSTGGGFPLWVLPAAGAVLAGAGIATVRARR